MSKRNRVERENLAAEMERRSSPPQAAIEPTFDPIDEGEVVKKGYGFLFGIAGGVIVAALALYLLHH